MPVKCWFGRHDWVTVQDPEDNIAEQTKRGFAAVARYNMQTQTPHHELRALQIQLNAIMWTSDHEPKYPHDCYDWVCLDCGKRDNQRQTEETKRARTKTDKAQRVLNTQRARAQCTNTLK